MYSISGYSHFLVRTLFFCAIALDLLTLLRAMFKELVSFQIWYLDNVYFLNFTAKLHIELRFFVVVFVNFKLYTLCNRNQYLVISYISSGYINGRMKNETMTNELLKCYKNHGYHGNKHRNILLILKYFHLYFIHPLKKHIKEKQ